MTSINNFNYSPLTTEEVITDSKRKVLTCPGCQKIFNRNSRIPFTLPCSHILCKECVSKSICPLDNKKIKDTNSLIICQTFLDFLPKKKFLCNCSNKKPVSYMCSFDNEVFCSNCLKKHMNSPHKNFAFVPNSKNLLNDLDSIKNHSNEELSKISKNLDYLSDIKIKLIDVTKDEITKLNTNFEKLIEDLMQFKINIENEIKNIYSNQLNQINSLKENLNQSNNVLINIREGINLLINKCNKNEEIIYKDILKEKNIIIQNWEKSLKNRIYVNSIINNKINFIFPCVNYNFDKKIFYELINTNSEKKKNTISKHNSNNNFTKDSTNEHTRKSNPSTQKKSSEHSATGQNNNNNININKNKLFIVDLKSDEPILLNDYNNLYDINHLKENLNNKFSINNNNINNNFYIQTNSNNNEQKKERYHSTN